MTVAHLFGEVMPKLHLFIDTNILLNFYSFPEDQLGVIDELVEHICDDKIAFHLPKHVENEFERNRESKLRAAIIDFKNLQLPTAIPAVMRGTETANQYEDALKKAQAAKKTLIANITGLAHERELEVDKKISALFERATRYDEDDECFARAVARMHKGNPPGKDNSLGDRYNWEVLLEHIPIGDLYIVSNDGDYASMLSDIDKKAARPMAFLANEWAENKNGASLHIATKIKAVVDRFKELEAQPDAPLVEQDQPVEQPQDEPVDEATDEDLEHPEVREALLEEEKNRLVDELCNSRSFSSTHHSIRNLTSFRPFLKNADAEKLFVAALENTQIGGIITDGDVFDFYVGVLNDHISGVDGGLLDAVIELLGLEGPDEESQHPFADGWELL